MRKNIYIALAACAVLAACTKNEVKPVVADQEITFQTISTKTASAMDPNNKFVSYAYFLPETKSWAADYASANLYFGGQLISYVSEANAWKAGSTYYWPKQGSLTFFAWSLNNGTPALSPSPSCSQAKGISVEYYDAKAYQNVDFLVAEIAKDQTNNTTGVTGKTWKNGVPTVFKHALSKLAFKVMTVDESGDAYDYSADATKFTVKSVKLQSVKNKRAYDQTWTSVGSGHYWTDATETEHVEFPVFTGSQDATKTETLLTKSATDYEIVIPQGFETSDATADLLEIKYDITTSYTGTPVVEHVTQYVKLHDVYPNDWVVNKFYTLTIKIGLNQIYWAPTVEEWEPGSTNPVKF